MSGLFSSPSSQAQKGTGGQQGFVNQEIGNEQQYVQQHEQMLRDAIAQMPRDPTNEYAFGNTGPGLSFGKPTVTPGKDAPPIGGGKQKPPPPPKG